MVQYQYRGLTVVEQFFCCQDVTSPCDFARYFQVQTRECLHGLQEQTTRLISLEQSIGEINDSLNSGCRREIRRAIKSSEVRCEAVDREQLTEVCLSKIKSRYDELMAPLGVAKMNLARLKALNREGRLVVTKGYRNGEDGFVIFHVYLQNVGRARLLYSFSDISKEANDVGAILGRANRALHWMDICHFKEIGMEFYDLGGVYTGTTDKKKINIRRFKDEFGGRLVQEFNGYRPCSLKGCLVSIGLGVARKLWGRTGEGAS